MSEQIAYVGDTSGDEILDVSFFEQEIGGVMRDCIHIKVPGDKTVEVKAVVNDQYRRRFARKWEAYKNMQAIDTGTPISEWQDLNEGLVREFAYQGFRFIEQVAGAPDSAFARIQGGFQWRTRAQAYLNRGKKSAEEVISNQQAQIELLQQQMAQLLATTKTGEVKRGRKPKEATQSEEESVESKE